MPQASEPPRSDADARFTARALELARTSLGRASPNPAVGAVVVKDGAVCGEGIHEAFGGPHAEVNALKVAGERARGSTVHVSLEPCRHAGKTPPCTEALIAAGVSRVVYAMGDPDPEHAGAAALKEKDVEVVRLDPAASPGLAAEARSLYSYFWKHVRRKAPFVIAKWAMTADGRTATRTGDSHWVTGEEARVRARRLRAESDAVVVGVGTVLRDNPMLTARSGDGREPVRVIVDSRLRTPPTAELFSVAGGPVLVACLESAPEDREEALEKRGATVVRIPTPGERVALDAVLDLLYQKGRLRILSEGGPTILGALFDAGRVDFAHVFVAPKIVGGGRAVGAVLGEGVPRMSKAIGIAEARWEEVGGDMLVSGRVGPWDWMG